MIDVIEALSLEANPTRRGTLQVTVCGFGMWKRHQGYRCIRQTSTFSRMQKICTATATPPPHLKLLLPDWMKGRRKERAVDGQDLPRASRFVAWTKNSIGR
jgi:hypothetical protein